MICKYDWFLLPQDLKDSLRVSDSEPTLDATAYNEIVDKLTWLTLTIDLEKMARIVNHSSDLVDKVYLWNRLPEQVSQFCEHINTL